ncbi:DinB family protein [Psychrobacter sp. DAB_AL62B]|uniref:DinB family protein n=1 Tax=Psychrobacter sp. DAB_AL62B TaxID=1028420 RepID=UPI002381609E|nr:DinB family protein [Psychrobacter sp. DAB_AL62B]
MMKPHFALMANYNTVMNQKVCDSIESLSEDALWQDNKAFFGSILGTLNHLMVGDLIWLRRFGAHSNYRAGFKALESLAGFPSPTTLTQFLYLNMHDFTKNRQILDWVIIQFINETVESDYSQTLTYTNTQGKIFNKPFAMLLQHLFNHQTHHRGQLTTLLNQIGVDIGETDLLMLIPDADS